MVVYAISSGSMHEGGGPIELYDSAEKAIKFATIMVHTLNKENEEIHGVGTEYDYVERESYSYIKYWSSSIYYVGVYQMEVK